MLTLAAPAQCLECFDYMSETKVRINESNVGKLFYR